MPALQIVSLDTATPQLRAPASGDTYTAPRAMDISPVALTGSTATSSLSIAQTWNTTGTPTAIDLNVTDTASNATSLLMNLRVGGTPNFQVGKRGQITFKSRFGVAGANTGAFFDTRTDTGGGVVAGFGAGGGGWFFGGADADSFTAIAPTVGGFSSAAIGFGTGRVSYSPTQSYLVNFATATDVYLGRDAANTLAQRNGVNAQAFNIYNTFTDASNYERMRIGYSSNTLHIGPENAGTGSVRNFVLGSFNGVGAAIGLNSDGAISFFNSYSGQNPWSIQNNGNGGHFVPGATNTRDIGTSSLRVRNFFQGGGYHEMAEMTAPAAPATNNVRIYAQDNGAGKTQLMALFATGAAQQIAIEP